MWSGFENDWMAYLAYSGIAPGVLLALTGGLHLLSRTETRGEAKSRRVKLIAKGHDAEELLQLLKPAPRQGWIARLPRRFDLPHLLHRSGLRIAPDRFVLICAVLGAAGFILAYAPPGPLRALSIAFSAGVALPLLVVKARANERMKKLTAQLPDALDMLARGLKIGHPLNMSIGAVAEEMPDPIGTEFGIIFDQVTYGEDLPDAVQDQGDLGGGAGLGLVPHRAALRDVWIHLDDLAGLFRAGLRPPVVPADGDDRDRVDRPERDHPAQARRVPDLTGRNERC